MSIAIDIADAVVDLLNGADPGTFSQDFTARRRFVPTFLLARHDDQTPPPVDLSVLRVEIAVPPVQSLERADRRNWEFDVPAVLVVAKKLDTGDDDARELEMASLTTLLEELVEYLRDPARDVLSVHDAALDRVDPYQNFRPQSFVQTHAFFASVSLHYLLHR